jgi:hypothetical protein
MIFGTATINYCSHRLVNLITLLDHRCLVYALQSHRWPIN